MICKKCGSNIAENSKFCTYCGQKVEEIIIQSNLENQEIILPENTQAPQLNVDQTIQPNQYQEPKKKNNTWIFIILGVLLGIIAIVLVIFAFNKSSNNNVRILEKALGNLAEKGENSGTVDVKILFESETQDSINLSATLKYAKQRDDDYNFNLTLNKSILFEEINVYASLLNDDLTLFANSSLIDMLGLTSSTPSMWVYLTMTEEELEVGDDEEVLDDTDEYYLRDVLDQKHFKFIDEEDNLKHYQLVIDNELLNKIKNKAPSEEELKDFEDNLASINNGSTELTEIYYVDIYINNYNELVKISIDLSDSIEDETIKKVVLSLEFRDFGTTIVQIPNEAKNSKIDLETYIATYAIQNDMIDPTINTDYAY